MDYNEIYQKLFNQIKNHKYEEFTKTLNEIDPLDPVFDINIRDDQQNYLLTCAITLNLPHIVKLLIDHGARIDITDRNDRSILLIPITYSYIEILELLLNANKKNIGVSIVDMKDKNLKIPLHYAIELKNHKAIILLLQAGSSANVTDDNSNNSLHLAVKTRSLTICETIIKHIANPSARCNTGETSLHIACNLQLVEIARLLLAHKININVQDNSHEVTALHYSVILNNKELIALLLSSPNNADPNIQDIYGNTPLHYATLENNYEIALILTSSTATKNIINLNLWNIDGDTPLHIACKNNSTTITDYLNIFLEKTNLSFQDADGNTCLYFIIQLNMWQEFQQILIKKRLDIFIKNKAGIAPLDLIKDAEMNTFINLLIQSYEWRLTHRHEVWHYEWQNICAKPYDPITAPILKHVHKTSATPQNFTKICTSIIKDHILKLIKQYNDNIHIPCYDRIYPVPITKTCVQVHEGPTAEICTFTGSALDVLIGLAFLLKKHPDTCSTLSKNFAENNELCTFYKSLGIIITSKCEFLNFEIVWIKQRLYLMDNFFINFKRCISKNKRFIIIPLGIEMKEGSHANYLIYDHKIKEVERFEPHGMTTPPGLHYNPDLLDDLLELKFQEIDESIKYIRPKQYLPKIGFQLMDINEPKKKKIGDPIGWCALWVIWYVDQRLTYKDVPRKELVNALLRNIREQGISFKNLIRNYGRNIIDVRDTILKNSEMNINDWLNDQYTDKQINSVMNALNMELDKLRN